MASFLLIRNCQISSLIWFDVGCAERKLRAQFEPAVKQITIEDLLTHRSGLTYRTQIAGNTEVADLYEEIELMNSCLSPDENMSFFQIP